MKIGKYIFAFILLEKCLLGASLESMHIPPKSGTVIFVHGFMRTSYNMSGLVSSFKRDRWNVVNWSYPSRQKLIEEHANELVKKIKAITQRHPEKPVSFVTHSMGGLVVRCALNHPECPIEAKMGKAVLIAPPNRGSTFARKLHNSKIVRNALGSKSGRQLMTTSQDGFDQLGNFPENMPVLIIAGTAGFNPMIPDVNDGKVGLNETCLSTPHFHEKCFAGHSWICHSPSAIRKAKAFLSKPSISYY